eukprot:12504163-Heterocapsa_arctica.AAC.1
MSDFQPMSLADFMTSLPALAKAHERTGNRRRPPTAPELAEAAAAHPWIDDYASQPVKTYRQSGHSAASGAGGAEEDLEDLPDDALARVWKELDDKRKQWALDAVGR